MREIEPLLYRKLKARLYLRAVLPAFEDLLEKSEAAQEILGERKFSICFQVGRQLKSVLFFEDGKCLWRPGARARDADVLLHFLSEEQLNKEFENKGFRLPLPLKGQTRAKDISKFKSLSRLFEAYLRGDPAVAEDPKFRSLQVGIQLGIALRATKVLVEHEEISGLIMKDTPEGLAYFSVGLDGYGAWVEWKGGQLLSGNGLPDRKSDVTIEFFDADTALKVVGNQIDVMSAVGTGAIKLSGLIPLADSLGYVFERVPLYIKP
ncbi:MAG: hypothetical protein AAF546_06980 [Verrucomicrobiota bacterium]